MHVVWPVKAVRSRHMRAAEIVLQPLPGIVLCCGGVPLMALPLLCVYLCRERGRLVWRVYSLWSRFPFRPVPPRPFSAPSGPSTPSRRPASIVPCAHIASPVMASCKKDISCGCLLPAWAGRGCFRCGVYLCRQLGGGHGAYICYGHASR